MVSVWAKKYCPHVEEHVNLAVPATLNMETSCSISECENKTENWICLKCHAICCPRHANGHMAAHGVSSQHHIACGFGDLSFWCYQCNIFL